MKNKDREYLKMLCLTATSNAVQDEAEQLLHLCDIIISFAKDDCFVWRLEVKDKISFNTTTLFDDEWEITYAGNATWNYNITDNEIGSTTLKLLTLEQLINKITPENDYSW
jgi:hypothetical protein